MPPHPRFLALLRAAVEQRTFVKLTLGKPTAAADPSLRNLFVRPVTLKAGPHLSFVWRHATRDVTKNHPPAEALALLESALGETFADAHLFTPLQTARLQTFSDGKIKLFLKTADAAPPPAATEHDRSKQRPLSPDTPWLRSLGIVNDRGQPREGMTHKFRQIQKFTELLTHLLTESGLAPPPRSSAGDGAGPRVPAPTPSPSRSSAGDGAGPRSPDFPPSDLGLSDLRPSTARLASGGDLRVADMGAGKGYLTFATATLLGPQASIVGVERRPDLVELCNRVAREHRLAHLSFTEGDITPAPAAPLDRLDVLIALHACDTATDDALAAGIAAGARLLVVSPCCQKELRGQLQPPPVLRDALRHGIFQERQAEFVTDALRAHLLEWAGYRTKVFEFVSTEHTAKNLMIAAIKAGPCGAPDDDTAARLRAFAAFYGIRSQRLATHLGFTL